MKTTKKRSKLLASIFVVTIAFTVLLDLTGNIKATQAETSQFSDTYIIRVYFEDQETAHSIASWIEPLESMYEKGYLLLRVSDEEYNRLVEAGLRVEIDEALEAQFAEAMQTQEYSPQGILGYECYRTVEETFATAESIVASYPTLATWTDVGDSWEKTQGFGGYDMMVLRLTNSTIAGPKPKIFMTGAIHPNEYTTAELITRLAEYLVDNYGSDADTTWLLDYHEVHLMLHTNPDGRKKAESGLVWRKNTNQNYCGATSNNRGADLNRNFPFKWNCCGGSSGNPCSWNYRGSGPASEPEAQAVRDYIFAQFPDQRGPNDNDPAPIDATGIYLDIHSSGRLVLWPWGWTADPAPNGTQLQTLGRKLAFFNNHTPKQGIGLYRTDGTTKLFAYGEMGLAAYTIELGIEQFESCNYFENTLVPDNLSSLIYAIKAARTPYMTPAGPEVTNLSLKSTSSGNNLVTLNATLDDTRYNNSNGTEPTQIITAAEYYLDVPPWIADSSSVPIAMYSSDGSFDSNVEAVEAIIDTTNWSQERHIIFVRGQDGNGNWGVFSAIFMSKRPNDNCPDDPNKTEPGDCGCGISDTDTDSDGTPDCNDNCDDDPNKTDPGLCGCSILDTDTDSDGAPDCTDHDDDDDGMPDTWEIAYGLDPLIATGDDGRDGDLDKDFWTNYIEFINGTEPNNPNSAPVNNAPTAPVINNPLNNGETNSFKPILSINNSTDADEHALRYTFEVYSDLGLTSLIASSSGVQEGENTTAWQVDVSLIDNAFYYWRTRAFDGIGYSGWMATATFFVNAANDPPSIPSNSFPPDQSEVTTLQPTLRINDSIDVDFDSLTYEFGLYSDESMTTLEASIIDILEDGSGTTSWQIDNLLKDNTFYWWRAQARDNENEPSGWTDLFRFFVNTSNDAPAVPTIYSPQVGEELTTLVPVLEVYHSVDTDLDALSYFFEIDTVNTFDSNLLGQSGEIAESAGNITSWIPSELVDNTVYYWRVRAFDGAAYSEEWATGSFFANLFNDAPGTPTIKNPGDDSEVTSLRPTLVLNPSADLDLDQVFYDFEIYSDANLTNLVTSTNNSSASWQVNEELEDNNQYYWKARAVDEHNAQSDWTPTASLFVNLENNPPGVPTLNNPQSGANVATLAPTLSVNNSTDLDGDMLQYEFELYSDQNLTDKVDSAIIAQQDLITSWTVSAALTDNTVYYWRVRALDDKLFSSWMPTAIFTVDTTGAPTTVHIESFKNVSASATNVQKVDVTDADSPIFGVTIEVPQGALYADRTITIGIVTNPPALPDNTIAISKVIAFGPDGETFRTELTIKIPYSKADLDSAGVNNPAQLQIFTYKPSILSWQELQIDSVDTLNMLLICKVDHFSMFTVAKSIVLQEADADSGGGGGGGGGGCFIATANDGYFFTEKIMMLIFLLSTGLSGLSRVSIKRLFTKK